MKLTKEMFDFEKYDYFDRLPTGEYAECFDMGQWVEVHGPCSGLCRKLKPPPRYILLNEKEALQAGDQYYSPLVNSWQAGIGNSGTRKACSGEVWRRKDTTCIYGVPNNRYRHR